jgi:hypothetical protein
MPTFADAPVEILNTGTRKIYIWLTETDEGGWAVDYEARPGVIEAAIMTPPPPRRRCLVAPTREKALQRARDRFRQMYATRKLPTVNPNRLTYH